MARANPPYRSLSADEIEQTAMPLRGASLPPVPTQMPPTHPRSNSKLPWILGGVGCLGVLCIAAVVIGVVLFMRSSSPVTSEPTAPQITQIVVAPTEQPLPTLVPVATLAISPTEAVQPPTQSAASPTELPAADAAADEDWPAGIGQQLVGNYFSDDFTTKKFEWAEVEDEIRTWGVQDGHYTLHLKEPDYSIWAYLPVEFTPTTITFDAAVQPGFDEGGYGILCHYQDDENYHYISIDPLNKEYAIGYVRDDEYHALTSEDWVPATHLKESPHAINNIIIMCEPESILLMINSELEAQVDMEAATPGDTAILGDTWEDSAAPGFKVLFDNFFAYIPAQ